MRWEHGRLPAGGESADTRGEGLGPGVWPQERDPARKVKLLI